MSCKHCVAAVTNALRELGGVSDVNVELSAGKVIVIHDETAALAAMRAAVEDAGFEVV